MLKLVSFSLVASAFIVAPVHAQGNQPAKSGQVTEKKICKQLPSSYSRHSNKVCMTAEQWKKLDQER